MTEDYNQYELNRKEKQNFLISAFVGIFVVVYIFYYSIFLSLICAMSAKLFMKQYARYKANKRKEFLLVQFKDLLYSLSASIASGRQMIEALGEARENLILIYNQDSPMIGELDYMIQSVQESREQDKIALLSFARRSQCEDIRSFVDVYVICRDTGGNIQKVIEKTLDILMDKQTIEREIKTMTAQRELEGKIITAMPIAVILFLNFMSPGYLQIMYTCVMGRVLMTLSLLVICASYYLIKKYIRIKV